MNKLFKPKIIKNLIKTILFTAIAVLGIGLKTASSYAGNCGCGNECKEYSPYGIKCENAKTCWFEGTDWSSANGCGGHSWYDAPENYPYYCSICGIYYAENQISGTTTTHIQHRNCHYCVGIKSASKVCAQPYVPPKYTITIHVNDAKENNTGNNGYNTYIGATFSNGQTVLSETVTEGESFSPVSSADITALTNGIPKGWHFLGFYDGSGKNAVVTNGKSYTLKSVYTYESLTLPTAIDTVHENR
ncbi:MAG: hypothetical protein IJ224_07035 [Lachnospiraceae bacterium]|nr:hypothetical protein [Lachnospiraceae bacterium]